MPIDMDAAYKFPVALIIDYFLSMTYMAVVSLFLIFYTSISLYFWALSDDLASILAEQPIGERMPIKQAFVQFVQLQLHFYKYSYWTHFPPISAWTVWCFAKTYFLSPMPAFHFLSVWSICSRTLSAQRFSFRCQCLAWSWPYFSISWSMWANRLQLFQFYDRLQMFVFV